MILQQLLFPNVETCERKNMYYKGDDITVFMEEKYCAIPQGTSCSTHTYFNSFSIGKWRKYTNIHNLYLRLKIRGSFSLRVHHAEKMLNQIRDKVFLETKICAMNGEEIRIPLPMEHSSGIYYFVLNALDTDAEFYGGAYETEVSQPLSDVKLAIGICTFRREKYVAKNLNMLKEHILENPDSPLYNNLEIYISDNGKSLPLELGTENIHIFPNKNLGGAGGFTRAMIEIKKASTEKGFTHFLLMDDDIQLSADSLVRTYNLLRLLKDEFKDVFIGGHMLRIDATNIQTEAADHWNIVAHHAVKPNYNLEKLEFIIKNEVEDSVNYLSWWYCCMPIKVISDTNLPLPVFIKRDDIEYGLRNGKQFLTLNGICVWHEPFEYKASSYLEYYYFRNMCIMNSKHRLSFTKKQLIKEVWKRTRTALLRYRYKDAELCLLGVQHYLKGIDWLKKQDAEKLNSAIMALGYKKQPVENIDFVFTHGLYEKNLSPKFGRKAKLIRKCTLNGWLLPAKKSVIVPAYQPSTALFYRAKKVLNYEEVSNSGFVTTREYRSLFAILKMYFKTKKMIQQNFDQITKEYRNRYEELTNLNFWNNYLFGDGELENISSILDVPKRPKNTKKQCAEILVSYGLRFLQILLFWLPVKRNRVMVYVHDRKGFTCNPKYIVQKLQKEYGDRLEIIWVSMHPETCKEITDMGIQVIKSNTMEHALKYFRTRFCITNDAFPSWALHRSNQKWMNTWHGAMNYKHIGYDYLAPMSTLASKIFKLKNRQPDFFLSGSEFFTKDTSVSFRLSEQAFLPTGLPRNDLLFQTNEKVAEKIRNHYNIPSNKHLVMFAPTFRRGMKSDTYGMDFDKVCEALNVRFGGEWLVLFRNHNFVKSKQNYYSGAVDVSGYHDMQELLYVTDVLISDYSSCLYDFSLTKRPAFVYATDLDNYMSNDRSFAFPIEKWPYPLAKTNEQLISNIEKFDEKDYMPKVEKHLEETGSHDNGTASAQVVDLICKYCL